MSRSKLRVIAAAVQTVIEVNNVVLISARGAEKHLKLLVEGGVSAHARAGKHIDHDILRIEDIAHDRAIVEGYGVSDASYSRSVIIERLGDPNVGPFCAFARKYFC